MAIITITRTLGSDGDTVARTVARQTGYRLVDRETLVAEAEAFSGGEVRRSAPEVEEKQPSFWERLHEERRRYNAMLRAAVFSLALRDNVIFLGMGAGFLLKDLSHVLRVQTVAPFEIRVRRFIEQELSEDGRPLSWEEAEQAVKHSDRERAGHIRYLFNRDWMQPWNYDLVINTERVSPEEAARLIVDAISDLRIAPTEASLQKLDDLALASRVEAMLINNPGVWIQRLRVTADRGRVTLAGEVITEEDRELAEQLVLRIPGVVEVVDDLLVQPPPLTGL